MSWFKVCLLIYFGLAIVLRTIELAKPQERKPIYAGMSAMINLLCFLGVWFWV